MVASKNAFYGWWVLSASFSIGFYVGGVVAYGFTAFFEPIAEEFGWSYAQISIAASLRGLEVGIFAPLVGFLVDRWGSRRLLYCGTFTVGFGLILLSQTDSLAMFYGAFLVIALGTSLCTGTVLTTAVANWFRRDVGKALGILVAGFGAGGLLLPPIIWLIDLYQWRIALIILGLGTWLIAIPLSALVRNKPKQYAHSADGDKSRRGNAVVEDGESEISFREALKYRAFWHIGIAETLRVTIVTAVVTHIIPYLSSIGTSRSRAAFAAAALPLISIIGRLGFGWLGDIFEKRYVLASAYWLAGLGLLAFSHIHLNWLIAPFLVFFPLSWGASALKGAIVRDYFGMASFGRIFGLMTGISTLGRVLGPTLAGWTYDTSGSYRLAWLFFAGTTLIAVALTLTVKPPDRGTR